MVQKNKLKKKKIKGRFPREKRKRGKRKFVGQ